MVDDERAAIDRVARLVVDAAFHVHDRVGPGLLESAYETFLGIELQRRGVRFRRQLVVGATYDGVRVDSAFRVDLLVDDRVVVEVKAVERVVAVHTRQLLTYLRLMDLRLGILVNFNVCKFKDGVSRVVNEF